MGKSGNLRTILLAVALCAAIVGPHAHAENSCPDPRIKNLRDYVQKRLDMIKHGVDLTAYQLDQVSKEQKKLDDHANACTLMQSGALALAAGSLLSIPAAVVGASAATVGTAAAATGVTGTLTHFLASPSGAQMLVSIRQLANTTISTAATVGVVSSDGSKDYDRKPATSGSVQQDLSNYGNSLTLHRLRPAEKYSSEAKSDLQTVVDTYNQNRVAVLMEYAKDNAALEKEIESGHGWQTNHWSPLYNPWRQDARKNKLQLSMLKAQGSLYVSEVMYLGPIYDQLDKQCEFDSDLISPEGGTLASGQEAASEAQFKQFFEEGSPKAARAPASADSGK